METCFKKMKSKQNKCVIQVSEARRSESYLKSYIQPFLKARIFGNQKRSHTPRLKWVHELHHESMGLNNNFLNQFGISNLPVTWVGRTMSCIKPLYLYFSCRRRILQRYFAVKLQKCFQHGGR